MNSYSKIPQLNIMRMHTHDSYEIYCFLSGDAEYSVEGNIYPLEPGDILIMKKAESHSLIIKSYAPYERIVINFYPEAIMGNEPEKTLSFIDNKPLGSHNRFPASVFNGSHWRYYLEKICSTNGDSQRAYLTVLLSELSEAYETASRIPQKSEKLSDIIYFINNNLTKDISLDDICKHSFLSKSQLNRRFNAITGTTPWEYITVKRLMLAKEYLSRGQLPSSVYVKCGFGDYSSFYRAYKSKFGVSPAKDCKKMS